VTGVQTNRGRIACGTVISCVAGWSTLVCDMVDVPLPITTHILQACVTEPVKPLLDVVIVSSQMHVYISQTDRGEFVMGSEIEPWTTYRMNGTLKGVHQVTLVDGGIVLQKGNKGEPITISIGTPAFSEKATVSSRRGMA